MSEENKTVRAVRIEAPREVHVTDTTRDEIDQGMSAVGGLSMLSVALGSVIGSMMVDTEETPVSAEPSFLSRFESAIEDPSVPIALTVVIGDEAWMVRIAAKKGESA